MGYPLKGLNIVASRALKTDGKKAVERERMLQGEYEFTIATPELRRRVVSEWQQLQKYSRNDGTAVRSVTSTG